PQPFYECLAAMFQVVDFELPAMGLLLLLLPGDPNGMRTLGEGFTFLASDVAFCAEFREAAFGRLFVEKGLSEHRRGVQHRSLAFVEASLSGGQAAFTLAALLTALGEVGLDLALFRFQGGEALLGLRQRHFGGGTFLLAKLAF